MERKGMGHVKAGVEKGGKKGMGNVKQGVEGLEPLLQSCPGTEGGRAL